MTCGWLISEVIRKYTNAVRDHNISQPKHRKKKKRLIAALKTVEGFEGLDFWLTLYDRYPLHKLTKQSTGASSGRGAPSRALFEYLARVLLAIEIVSTNRSTTKPSVVAALDREQPSKSAATYQKYLFATYGVDSRIAQA